MEIPGLVEQDVQTSPEPETTPDRQEDTLSTPETDTGPRRAGQPHPLAEGLRSAFSPPSPFDEIEQGAVFQSGQRWADYTRWPRVERYLKKARPEVWQQLLERVEGSSQIVREQMLRQNFANARLQTRYQTYATTDTARKDRAHLALLTTDPGEIGLICWNQPELKAARVKASGDPGKELALIGADQENLHGAYRVGLAIRFAVPLPERGDQAEQEKTSRHAITMELAKGVAYDGAWDEKTDKRLGLSETYKLEAGGISGIGFQYAALTPQDGRDEPPVLAFAGTNDFLDVLTDFDPESPGYSQFSGARNTIRAVLAKLQPAGPIVLTGHSLGGALAQLTAAWFAGEFNFQAVTTFNAPGIPQGMVDRFVNFTPGDAAPEVTHYTAREDAVSRAGPAALPGENVQISRSEDKKGDAHGAHTDPLFETRGGRYQLDGDSSRRVSGAHFDDPDRPLVHEIRGRVRRLLNVVIDRLELKPTPKDFSELTSRLGDYGESLKPSVAELLFPMGRILWKQRIDRLQETIQIMKPELEGIIGSVGKVKDGHLKATLRAELLKANSAAFKALNYAMALYAVELGIIDPIEFRDEADLAPQ